MCSPLKTTVFALDYEIKPEIGCKEVIQFHHYRTRYQAYGHIYLYFGFITFLTFICSLGAKYKTTEENERIVTIPKHSPVTKKPKGRLF